MSGTEFQRTKEDQAAIMRAKQAAGKHPSTMTRIISSGKRAYKMLADAKKTAEGSSDKKK